LADSQRQVKKALIGYDLVVGDISDDRLYSTFDGYLANKYTEEFTMHLVKRLKHPLQFVTKSTVADSFLQYQSSVQVPDEVVKQTKQKFDSDKIYAKDWIKIEAEKSGLNDKGLKFEQRLEEVRKDGFRL
jgi:hypothetical protein